LTKENSNITLRIAFKKLILKGKWT